MNKKKFLSFAVFIVGLCSIIYELLISTTATYFLGDGVRQFSLIIGIYLFSMGVGAYMAQLFSTNSLRNLIVVEYILGFVGGVSVPLLYFLFTSLSILGFQFACLGLIFVIGFLTGLEIPLLTFSFKSDSIKENLSHVLSLDYVGGLAATLIFPFVVLPFIGLFYASLAFGMVNIVLGIMLNLLFFPKQRKVLVVGFLVLLTSVILVLSGGYMLDVWEHKIYKSPIVVNKQTPYQKIVMTKRGDNVKLFLNRVIQFASEDEHRYHESIAHVPMMLKTDVKDVLVLGGGENLVTRELVKYPEIETIDVVDIDTAMFRLALDNKDLIKINDLAPYDPRVSLIADDAFSFLYKNQNNYDLIIADLPDPNSESLARLYSQQFFNLVKRNLSKEGVFITQSGDINNSNSVFSCINGTLKEVFGKDRVIPFHVYIPSFGDWGFNIGLSNANYTIDTSRLPMGLKYLDKQSVESGFHFPKDVQIVDVKVNTLDQPVILDYFLDDYSRFKQNSN